MSVFYNFTQSRFPVSEAPGASAFYRDADGIFHSYTTQARGLDTLNGAYHWMNIAPKGRDEGELDHTMAWLRRRDQYE